ncbi:albusnodin family lasso peptide [Streptomyces sp. NPDC051567]
MNEPENTKGSENVAELPAVIDLGDAATLTQGSTSSSVEGKQTPYN